MKKLLSMLIVAVMLFGMIPFAFAADVAPASIKVDEKKTVSVDRYTPNNVFEFVAPKTATYFIYSESEDIDTYVSVFDKDGKLVVSNNGYTDANFGVHYYLEKGEKITIKPRCYYSARKAQFTMTVTEVKAPTAIVVEKDKITVYPGQYINTDHSFAPIGSLYEDVTITLSNEEVVGFDEEGYLCAKKVGSAVLTYTTESGLSKNVEVTVADWQKLDLNVKKSGTLTDACVEYAFTPAESGYYTFEYASSEYLYYYIKSEEGWHVNETYTDDRSECVYLDGGVNYVVGASLEYSDTADYSILVKKATPATTIEIVNEKGDVMPIEFSSELYLSGVDGYLADEVEWSVDDTTVAHVTTMEDGKNAYISFVKEGMVVVTAKVGNVTEEIFITGKKSPELKLNEAKKVTVTYDTYQNCYTFTPAKSGWYTIDALDISIGVYSNGNFYDGYDYCEAYLEAGKQCNITLSTYSEEIESEIKITELKDATTFRLGNTEQVKAYSGKELYLDFVTNGRLNGEIKLDITGPSDNYYADCFTKTAFITFNEVGEYTVTATCGNLKDSIKVKVEAPEKLEYKVKKQIKLTKDNPIHMVEYFPTADGLKNLKVTSDVSINVGYDEYASQYGDDIAVNIDCFEQRPERFTIELDETDEATVTIEIAEPMFATYMIPIVKNYVITVGTTDWIDEIFVFLPGYENEQLTYTSSNEKVVKFNENNRAVAVAKGSATITATSEYGLTATTTITVVDDNYDWAFEVGVDKPEINVEVGKSDTITAKFDSVSKKTVSYASFDPSVAVVDDKGRVTGVSAGSTYIIVSVDNAITGCVVNVSAPKMVDSSKVFTDVKAGKWYSDAIDYAYSYGFIKGITKTTFERNTEVNRGMFITILARIAGVDTGKEANKTTTKFSDVKSGKYYTAAIKWANENGVVAGVSKTKFGPETSISRQDLCVMVTNFAKYMHITLKTPNKETKFKDDTSIAKYAKNAVKSCQMADIVTGYKDGSFGPRKTATRAEAAQILYIFHRDYVA